MKINTLFIIKDTMDRGMKELEYCIDSRKKTVEIAREALEMNPGNLELEEKLRNKEESLKKIIEDAEKFREAIKDFETHDFS